MPKGRERGEVLGGGSSEPSSHQLWSLEERCKLPQAAAEILRMGAT